MMKALESLVICSLRPASVPRTPVSCSPVDLKGADIRRKDHRCDERQNRIALIDRSKRAMAC
jgi:hypothetical protein